jgi:hypothetical protein
MPEFMALQPREVELDVEAEHTVGPDEARVRLRGWMKNGGQRRLFEIASARPIASVPVDEYAECWIGVDVPRLGLAGCVPRQRQEQSMPRFLTHDLAEILPRFELH